MSGDVIRLSEQDRGREVPVRPGDVIELHLPENPTTGMRWALDPVPGVEVVGDTYAGPGADPGAAPGAVPGAAATRILRLRVSAPTRLHLRRAQAWEPGTPPEAEFACDLVMR